MPIGIGAFLTSYIMVFFVDASLMAANATRFFYATPTGPPFLSRLLSRAFSVLHPLFTLF